METRPAQKYNQAYTLNFNLYEVDGVDMRIDATFAAGDIKIMKDEGVEANTTNLPTDEGQGYSLVLTATEMSASRIVIYIVDQTATKVWLDIAIAIETYGNASAQHAFDLDTASVAQTGDNYARLGAPTGASVSADIAALNDISPAEVNAEVDTALADYDGPTNAEMVARTLAAADYFDPAADTVAQVTDVANQVDANVTAISGDSVAADNLEAQYDTTGLTGDTFPATQAQVGNISSGTAATNTVASGAVITTGSEVNDYTDTATLDGVVHEVNPSGGNTDFYYEFDVGANGVPVSIQWQGYANSNGDSYAIYAYNWSGAAWQQIGTINAVNGSTIVTDQFDLTTAHVGTGVNVGLVRFRVESTDGTGFNTDRILCSFSTVYQSVGYANGAIWVDTNASNTSTEAFIDGTADNPVSTWAAALTLSASLNIERFAIINGSSITLTANSDNYTMIGRNWSLDLNSQSVSAAYIEGATVIGTGSGGNQPEFVECIFGDGSNNLVLPAHIAIGCKIFAQGTYSVTIGTGVTVWDRCVSAVSGNETPRVIFLSGADLNCRGYMGGLQFESMEAGNLASFDCPAGQLKIHSDCTGGTIRRAGMQRLTDNAAGAVTVTEGYGMTIGTDADERVDVSLIEGVDATDQIRDSVVDDATLIDASALNTLSSHDPGSQIASQADITGLNDVSPAEVNAEVDTALADYDGPTKAEMDAGFAGLNDPTAGAIADAVWDEAIADHLGAGSTGAALNSAGSAGDPWSTALPGAYGAGTAGNILGNNLDASVADVEADTQDIQATLAGLNDISPAEVNAEVDTALADYDGPTKAELDAGFAGLNDPTAGAIADAVWDEAKAGHVAAGSFGEEVQAHALSTEVSALNDISPAEVNAEVDTALTDYDGPTKAEMDAGFAALNDPTVGEIADQVWDEPIAGHLGAGSTGEALNAAGAAGDPWTTALPGAYGAGSAGNIIGNNLDASVADVEADTQNIQSTLAGQNDISPAEVNAEVDNALADYDGPTKAEMDAGFAGLNDVTAAEAADAVWDEAKAGHVGAGSFGEEVQAHALSTEVSALNDISPAEVNAEVDTALADYDGPTKAELDAGFAALNDVTAAEVRAEMDANSTQLAAILADTNELQTDDIPGLIAALNDLSSAEVNAEMVDVLTVDLLADSYAADGAQPTIGQAALMILQFLTEKEVVGTAVTVKKPDGSTTAMGMTLDDGTAPTSITRTS